MSEFLVSSDILCLFYAIENVIEHFLAYIEHRAVFRDRLLGHPFWQTVVLSNVHVAKQSVS